MFNLRGHGVQFMTEYSKYTKKSAQTCRVTTGRDCGVCTCQSSAKSVKYACHFAVCSLGNVIRLYQIIKCMGAFG